MRAVVQGIEVEGTPSEISELIKSFQVEMVKAYAEALPKVICEEDASVEESGMPTDFAYRTLRRLPLSKMQRSLFSILRKAHPGWIGASDILSELSWNGLQLGGVLGGLGRRLTATKGYREGFQLWEWTWDDDEGEYAYRLPDAVLVALDRMGI